MKGVKTGVIVRSSANQDAHDAICHHFVVIHVFDGTITIALIIDNAIVISIAYAIVQPLYHTCTV